MVLVLWKYLPVDVADVELKAPTSGAFRTDRDVDILRYPCSLDPADGAIPVLTSLVTVAGCSCFGIFDSLPTDIRFLVPHFVAYSLLIALLFLGKRNRSILDFT